MQAKQKLCSMEPVIINYTQSGKISTGDCTQTGKKMAGFGSVWSEVPKETSRENVGAYVITREALNRARSNSLNSFLMDEPGTCPSCFSICVDVYPNSEGVCCCNGCNDNIPPDLED